MSKYDQMLEPPGQTESDLYCALCGEPIYDGDTYYDLGGDMTCTVCLKNEYEKMK